MIGVPLPQYPSLHAKVFFNNFEKGSASNSTTLVFQESFLKSWDKTRALAKRAKYSEEGCPSPTYME